MTQHEHKNECDHELRHCKQCNAIECLKCAKEWFEEEEEEENHLFLKP